MSPYWSIKFWSWVLDFLKLMHLLTIGKVKVNQSHYKPGQALRIPVV
jgi:hypothetical protein